MLPEGTGIPTEILQNLTKYYEIVPKTVFLMAYVDVDSNTARQRAASVASKFSSAFSAQLSLLMAFPSQQMELGNTMHSVTFVVYQSTKTLSDIGANIMTTLPTQKKGLATVVDYAYKAGILTPRLTKNSANGTIMAVGFFSSSIISDMIESTGSGPQQLLGLVLPNATAPTPMLGIFSYWLNKFHSSSFLQSFSINDLLNYQQLIQFSPNATVSAVAVVVPNATIQGGKVVSQSPIASIVTSVNLTKPEFASVLQVIQSLSTTTAVKVTQASPGTNITAQTLGLSFTQVFPLELRVEKTVSLREIDIGQRIDVTVRIINDDADAAANVTLDDSLVLDYYGSWAVQLASGNLTHSWSRIAGGSTVTHTYSLLLKKEGVYTIPDAELTYNYVDQTFGAQSNFVYVTVKSPPALNIVAGGITSAWGILTRTIDKIPGMQGKGSLVLTSVLLVIIAPLAFFEYRNVRKWLKTRKQAQ
jgi:hypothetical protein